MAPEPLSIAQLNRAFLARQWLLERKAATPLKAIEHLVGLQAQEPKDPYVALWSRLSDFEPKQLETLLTRRKAGRLGLMRSTLHLVSARDAKALWPLTQIVLERTLRGSHGKHLAGVDIEQAANAGKAMLAREPMSYAALRKRLAEQWPDVDEQALAQLVRARLSLVQIPPRGLWSQTGPPILVPADRWFADAQDKPLDEVGLVSRYLAAFGPASVADMQAWCGLTKLQAAFDAMDDGLLRFMSPAGKTLFDLPKAPRPDADTPAPPRFLPVYDNAILGLRDRSRILPAKMPNLELRQNENVRFILIDGAIGATWRLEKATQADEPGLLRIEPFIALSRTTRAAVKDESQMFLETLGPKLGAEIRIG